MNKITKYIIGFAVVLIVAVAFAGLYQEANKANTIEVKKESLDSKKAEQMGKEVEKIMNSSEFQKKVKEEAERIYYRKIKEEAEGKLQKLNKGGFTGETVEELQSFLEGHNSSLSHYAGEIIRLPRWREVVAITGKETSFCKAGVGRSRNNCGGIKNNNGEFKYYRNKMDAVEDIAILLQKDLYKDKTIEEMNGTYCVDSKRVDGKCIDWSEHINEYLVKLSVI